MQVIQVAELIKIGDVNAKAEIAMKDIIKFITKMEHPQGS